MLMKLTHVTCTLKKHRNILCLYLLVLLLFACSHAKAIELHDILKLDSGLSADKAAYIELDGDTLPAEGTVNLTTSVFAFYTGVTLNGQTCTGMQSGNDVTITSGGYSFSVSSMPKQFRLNSESAFLLAQAANVTYNLVACLEVQNLRGNVSGTPGYELSHSLAYNEACNGLTQVCQATFSTYLPVEFQL